MLGARTLVVGTALVGAGAAMAAATLLWLMVTRPLSVAAFVGGGF